MEHYVVLGEIEGARCKSQGWDQCESGEPETVKHTNRKQLDENLKLVIICKNRGNCWTAYITREFTKRHFWNDADVSLRRAATRHRCIRTAKSKEEIQLRTPLMPVCFAKSKEEETNGRLMLNLNFTGKFDLLSDAESVCLHSDSLIPRFIRDRNNEAF